MPRSLAWDRSRLKNAAMVYLNRIYTRAGDSGETGLGDGTRVSKAHPRIQAYGGVDELNSSLGVLLALANPLPPAPFAEWIRQIQNDLFDVGADLCIPESAALPGYTPLRVKSEQVARLEGWIDALNAGLRPLTSFILPGGNPAAALLHQSRTICRRCEIGIVALMDHESVNPQVLAYVNRLSDLLFVAARFSNSNGESDILWRPGGDPAPH